MLTLWGRANSINVQKVVWCLEELALPYERIDAGLAFGINRTPDYLAMNPNGLVPVLKDGDLVLWESNATVRYLAAAYDAGGLWPEDPRQRALADRWCDWQLSVFNPAFNDAFHGLVRSPGSRTPEQIATAHTKTEAAMRLLDRHLASRAFLAGDRLSFGDVVLGSSIHRWFHMPIERQPTLHVRRWYDALAARPATRKVFLLPID